MKDVSVIIPVLNEERVIARRLAELRALGLEEVIVADGGSTDGTEALVARFPEVRWLEAPRGRARQMNAGAALARGRVLLFLHADVELPRDALEVVARTLEDPQVVAGAFRTWTVADRPTRLGPLLHLADLRSRCSRLPYGDQALFVRAEVFQRLGGFPAQPLMEDLELSRRLWTQGRVEVARARVQVSGRRFIEHPLRYTFLINVFPALYRLGVPPERLARLYEHVR